MTSRIFIALDFSEDVLGKIVELREGISDGISIKWEPPGKLHLTLKFLGDVESGKIEEIIGVLDKNLTGFGCVSSIFDRFGIFRKFNKPKILWLGIRNNDKLNELAAYIDDLMFRLGFEREKRRFTPHLTLLRIKHNIGESLLKKYTDHEFEGIDFNSCDLSLIKSELKPEGSVYTVLKKFNLKE